VYQESDRRSSAETHNASPWSWRQLTSKIRHCSIGSKVSTSVVFPMHTQILTLAKAALLIVATAIIRIFRSFTSNGISTLRGCEMQTFYYIFIWKEFVVGIENDMKLNATADINWLFTSLSCCVWPTLAMSMFANVHYVYYALLHCALASSGAVYCNRSCLWVCLFVCLWVCGCVCLWVGYHDNSK